MRVDGKKRFKAARHEVRCWECRVTWRSWALRVAGIGAGYAPSVGPVFYTAADHRNGHHVGHDRACWRCWLRAAVGRTPSERRLPDA